MRLKLYLSMVLLGGSSYTHKTFGANAIANLSRTSWAEILALPDPAGKGARRIADAQNALSELRMITVHRLPGQPPLIRLLSAAGTGRPFVEPTTPYIRVPLTLWTKRWIWTLRGKELAVLVALIDLCAGRTAPQALSGTTHAGYGMSEDTWRLATIVLSELGIVRTTRDRVELDLEGKRMRKLYSLDLTAMDRVPSMNDDNDGSH